MENVKIIKVGPDELDKWDMEHLEKFIDEVKVDLIIYHYEIGSYEGDGQILFRDILNNYYYTCLAHCSCYGPTDNISRTSVEEVLHSENVLDEDFYPSIKNKLEEILREESGV